MRSRSIVSWVGWTLVVVLGGCGAERTTVSPEPAPLVAAASFQPTSSCEADEAVTMVVVGLEPREGPEPRITTDTRPARDRRGRIGTRRRAANEPSSTPVDAPPRAPTPSCSDVPSPSIEQVREERRVVELVNAERARGAWCGDEWFPPVAPLRSEPRLQCAAQAHSYDMATHGYFGHDDLRGRSPFERIAATGYPRGASAENISAGQPSAASVVAGWMESPGHCANIMGARYTEIGVGHAMAADIYGHYWTQTFGAR